MKTEVCEKETDKGFTTDEKPSKYLINFEWGGVVERLLVDLVVPIAPPGICDLRTKESAHYDEKGKQLKFPPLPCGDD